MRCGPAAQAPDHVYVGPPNKRVADGGPPCWFLNGSACRRAAAVESDVRLIGEPIVAVLPLVTAALGEEPEHENYGSLETFFYRRNWVELQVRFGSLESINCGVVYNEADEPQWPSA